jgi:hypothetical protein
LKEGVEVGEEEVGEGESEEDEGEERVDDSVETSEPARGGFSQLSGHTSERGGICMTNPPCCFRQTDGTRLACL